MAQCRQVRYREKAPVRQRAVQPRGCVPLGQHKPVPIFPLGVLGVDAHFLIIKVGKHIGRRKAAARVPRLGAVGGFNHTHTDLAGCNLQRLAFFFCHSYSPNTLQ